jgi:hypothetical protein
MAINQSMTFTPQSFLCVSQIPTLSATQLKIKATYCFVQSAQLAKLLKRQATAQQKAVKKTGTAVKSKAKPAAKKPAKK